MGKRYFEFYIYKRQGNCFRSTNLKERLKKIEEEQKKKINLGDSLRKLEVKIENK